MSDLYLDRWVLAVTGAPGPSAPRLTLMERDGSEVHIHFSDPDKAGHVLALLSGEVARMKGVSWEQAIEDLDRAEGNLDAITDELAKALRSSDSPEGEGP